MYVKNAHSGTMPADITCVLSEESREEHPVASRPLVQHHQVDRGLKLSNQSGGKHDAIERQGSPRKDTMAKGQKWIFVEAIVIFRILYGINGLSRHSSNSFHPSSSIALST